MMYLGSVEVYEVWFIPANRDAYSPRVECECYTIDEAKEVIDDLKHVMNGELEIVRVKTTRQRIGVDDK